MANRKSNKRIALVLGLSVNGLSVVRSLGRKGFRVIALDRSAAASYGHSRYVSEFERVAVDIPEQELLKKIFEIGARFPDPLFLLPTNDFFSLFVARNQEALREHFAFVVASESVQKNIVNKSLLYEAAARLGIPCPATFSPENTDELEKILPNVRFPCFLKPAYAHLWRQRYSNAKVLRIENREELLARFRETQALDLSVMIQEIIPGEDDTLHGFVGFMAEGGAVPAACTKHKFRQFPPGAGDGCLQELTQNKEVADLGTRLLRGLGYAGPFAVEFRLDFRDGLYKLIEINARTISSQEMIARGGINIPYMAYQYAVDGAVEPVTNYRAGLKWVCFEWDFESFRQLRRAGQLTFGEWLKSLRGISAFAFWAWDDPLPCIFQLAGFFKRLIWGLLKRSSGYARNQVGNLQMTESIAKVELVSQKERKVVQKP